MRPSGLAVGLHCPKKPQNVGGAMRHAACFGADLIVIGDSKLDHDPADTPKSERLIPTILTPHLIGSKPVGYSVVAVERTPDAVPLYDYEHPTHAYYLFGPEGGSLTGEMIERADATVEVPMRFSMNLATTVAVVLYDRAQKKRRRERGDGLSLQNGKEESRPAGSGHADLQRINCGQRRTKKFADDL